MSQSSRLWMYDRMYESRGGIKPAFYNGIEEFLLKASEMPEYRSNGKVRCPCAKCNCRFFYDFESIRLHLCRKGFMENYWIWTYHGEVDNRDEQNFDDENTNDNVVGSSSGVDVNLNVDEDNVGRYTEMVHDAYGVQFGRNQTTENDMPNDEDANFFSLLESVNKPLWEGSNHSELSVGVRMLSIKSESNQSQSSFNQWATLLREVSPSGSGIPEDFYNAKKLVSQLGLNAVKIDCCQNGCMLFYKEDAELTQCKFCESRRYKPRRTGTGKYKNIPFKRMHYLPLIPRLKRLFSSNSSAPHMRWHYENRRSDRVMTHPSHGEAWKHFDNVYPTFAADPRNVRLGLCSDGFTPNREFSNTYSCWPVIVTPYNLPPEMCMKDPYMFLTCIIPGPKNPKVMIDVFLQPLIDELKELWTNGVVTYDVSSKENFVLRAALMWTINDFPAYGMLSGWMTQGKLACPVCMEDTKAFTLRNGGKNSWFDCHRRFLPANHPFRRDRIGFKKNKADHDDPSVRLSGRVIWNRVRNLPKITELGNSTLKLPGYGVEHNWTKQSIFWELPYWKDNLVRHCIDVMHVEKNVCDNIVNTVMNTDKTKDNVKSRYDLEEYCSRSELHMFEDDHGHMVKRNAAYNLNARQKQAVCQWIQQLRMPDGYASNLSRCVNESQCKLVGMKSHDCHVLLQCLLPAVFRELPLHVWKPLTELSIFFRDLCSATLNVNDLCTMEENIALILCKLERIFPPSFFDSMEHLPIHLAYEARVCGPVQYRWMYPFERNIGVFKRMVKNRARVEGSICEAYLSKETSFFCSYYFEAHVHTKRTNIGRNDDGGETSCPPTLSVFNRPGRGFGRTKDHYIVGKEWDAAHLHVLINCDELQSFKDYYEQLNPTSSINEYPAWLKAYVEDPVNNITNPYIRTLVWGPMNIAKSWPVYFANGFKFHTVEHSFGKTTNNSGVSVRGDAGDGESTWYGVLHHIYELEYVGDGNPKLSVVLFECEWYDPTHPRGTRKHNDYDIMEVHSRRRFQSYDPFIFPQDARQVYFSKFPGKKKSDWMVVFPTKARGRIEIDEVQQENNNAYQVDVAPTVRLVRDTAAPPSLRSDDSEMEIVHTSHENIAGSGEDEYEDEDASEGDDEDNTDHEDGSEEHEDASEGDDEDR